METGGSIRISPQGIKTVEGTGGGGQFKTSQEWTLLDHAALPLKEDEVTVSSDTRVKESEKAGTGYSVNVVEPAETGQPPKETVRSTPTASQIPTTIFVEDPAVVVEAGPDLMMPTNTGKIKHLLMTYDGKGNGYVELFKTLAEHMPDSRFTVLTKGDAAKKELEGALQDLEKEGRVKEPSRFNIRATDREISIWAQDSILVQGKTLIVPDRSKYAFSEKGDASVADLVAEANPEFRVLRSQGLFIDGGNEIASPEYLVVGSEALRQLKRSTS
ncbi:MAG: hypothetical protein HYU64_11070 [Armatimonadetes bacterium]|nr:hypothetical protein [Armatimonadota bacterium]